LCKLTFHRLLKAGSVVDWHVPLFISFVRWLCCAKRALAIASAGLIRASILSPEVSGCDHQGAVSHGASGEARGNDSNVAYLNAPSGSHGVAQVAIHLQVASQEPGVVNIQNADTAMYG
jgi:hypothetical protein